MRNWDPWFIEERTILPEWLPLQIYRIPGCRTPDGKDHLAYAVSFDNSGCRYSLEQLRAILAVAEQAERDLASQPGGAP